MRLVVQRVANASVSVDGEVVGQIGRGLLALVGITDGDDEGAAEWCRCFDIRAPQSRGGRYL